jgi:glucose-6-phosphate-specific signal transduction histidine kinase
MKALQIFACLFLLWAPRILGILFAGFTGLFAMDVFGQGTGFWETILALIMHLVPTFLMIVILILSWRWPWIGGLCFALLGIVYIIWFSQTRGEPSAIIYLPMFLTAAFFLASWFLRRVITKARDLYNEEMGV